LLNFLKVRQFTVESEIKRKVSKQSKQKRNNNLSNLTYLLSTYRENNWNTDVHTRQQTRCRLENSQSAPGTCNRHGPSRLKNCRLSRRNSAGMAQNYTKVRRSISLLSRRRPRLRSELVVVEVDRLNLIRQSIIIRPSSALVVVM